ncbi:MAG: hypothetical protein KJ042_16205 [Deltaproteobacteria bacterium]|nr:hypothetical protein [Deltaproteobacteria bacterium]
MSRIVVSGDEHDAGKLAARHALAKALGREPDSPDFPAIEYLKSGAPVATGLPAPLRAHLTITHEDDRAVAVAIVEDMS